MSILGILNRHIMLPQTSFITFRAMIVGITSASGDLEKYSTATITNLFCSTVLGKGPRMSIPYCENSHGLVMLDYSVAGLLIALASFWQISYPLTNSPASFLIVG